MKNRKTRYPLILLITIVAASLFLSACSVAGKPVDPGDWGFDCLVTYNALGGVVNNREIRETFYLKNSYVFKPAGTTDMLIQPVKDGYILAGWYTAKEDLVDEGGKVTGYAFKAEDRWDFDEDRVQEDMLLYARWIPQAKVEYVDPETGEVMFSKNITGNDAITPLSSATENLIEKPGKTFDGYYADPELTQPFVFAAYTHEELVPSNKEVYEMLFELFPDYIREIEYEEPEESEDDSETEIDTSDLFIHKLGYEIISSDETVRAEIRRAKDEIYESTIDHYLINSAGKTIYLKYSEGRYAQISKASDLKYAGKTGFLGVDKSGNPVDGYIITSDIDFSGAAFTMGESFSGKIIGNNHTLSNFKLTLKAKKIDPEKHKEIALFKELNETSLENITFQDVALVVDVGSGVSVDAALLALKSTKSELINVTFDGIEIDSGRADNGKALYRLGDLFVEESGTRLENVKGENIVFKVSEFAEVLQLLD
ncbi:MAG: InlB B-repeat-containing protein [Clostridiaceae bacterium]|nr:InlB B-repeat-containing protein [Clostridiaceae bacterium]